MVWSDMVPPRELGLGRGLEGPWFSGYRHNPTAGLIVSDNHKGSAGWICGPECCLPGVARLRDITVDMRLTSCLPGLSAGELPG